MIIATTTTHSPLEESFLPSLGTHFYENTTVIHETNMDDFHGLPGVEYGHVFTRNPAAAYNKSSGNNLVYSSPYSQESHAEWHPMHRVIYQQYQTGQGFHPPSPKSDQRTQGEVSIRDPIANFAYNCTWSQAYKPQVFVSNKTDLGFLSGYSPDSLHPTDSILPGDFGGLDNLVQNNQPELPRLSFSQSPIRAEDTSSNSPSSLKDMPISWGRSSGACNDGKGESADRNLSTSLMEAPNHSMVLQDIYKWFIENTGKGGSTSTGWRNSIRHNLSMNAAFRKTSRKLNGSDSKRTSEWVLEPFAVREGVTPTTRYRKTGKKAYKHRSSSTRVKSRKSACLTAEKSKRPSHGFVGAHQDSTGERLYDTPMRQGSLKTENPNLSPYTPDCHLPLPVSHCLLEPAFLDSWEQYADLKAFQMEDRETVYVNGHDQFGDKGPTAWAESPYF